MAVPYRNGEPIVDSDVEEEAVPDYVDYVIFNEDDVRTYVHPYNPYFLELHAAIQHRDIETLRLILDNTDGAYIDQVTEEGETALHYACRFGDRVCAKILLERGASLEIEDDDGVTPLHNACVNGMDLKKMMELLLKSARSRDPECVKRIVKAVDRKGDTPLHYAARNGFLKGIKVLLGAGADPSMANNDGKVPKEVAPPESESALFLSCILSKAEFKAFSERFRKLLRSGVTAGRFYP